MQTYQTLAATRVLIALPPSTAGEAGQDRDDSRSGFLGADGGRIKAGMVLAVELADGTLVTLTQ